MVKLTFDHLTLKQQLPRKKNCFTPIIYVTIKTIITIFYYREYYYYTLEIYGMKIQNFLQSTLNQD